MVKKTLIESMREHMNLLDAYGPGYRSQSEEIMSAASEAFKNVLDKIDVFSDSPRSDDRYVIKGYWDQVLAPAFEPYFAQFGHSYEAYDALAEIMEAENLHAFSQVKDDFESDGYYLGSET